MKKGLIHVYYGDGKGKTTAALGLGLRASGRGLRALLLQFLKGQDSGEIKAMELLPDFKVIEAPERIPFYFQMDPDEKNAYRNQARKMFFTSCRCAVEGDADLLILDEGLDAIACEIVTEREMIDFLKEKPVELEVVLTGRNPTQEILSLADYITEMKKIRHPFDKGIPARLGIEK